jgi:hypothetical protein
MHHHNDNQPRSPAQHRAIVEALPETRQRPAGATHLGSRLYRERRADDLRRYIGYGKVSVVPSWLSAEGPLPEGRMVMDGDPEGGAVMQADLVTEIKPGLGELERISNWIKAGEEGVRTNSQGHITEWRGADGKFRPVAELTRQPKGKRRKSEGERQEEASRHLSLRGSGRFPESLPYAARASDGADYWRLRHAAMLRAMNAGNDNRRQEIDRLGVGSRTSFDEAWVNAGLPPASRLPAYVTGIARGAEFLAFSVHSNPRAMPGGVEGGHDLVERQLVETIDQPKIDAALGDHTRILDPSAAGMTARQIAVELGLGDTKAAERKVVALQDQALAALASVDEKMAA